MPLVILLGDSARRRYEPAVRRLLAAAAAPSLDVWAPDENCETSERILANLDIPGDARGDSDRCGDVVTEPAGACPG